MAKKYVISISTLMMLFVGLFFISPLTGQSLTNDSQAQNKVQSSDSLKIINNNELIQYAENNSILGTGSKFDPFIIENQKFESAGANYEVEIRNTDLFILIRNNMISYGLKEGILLSNASNVQIQGNYFFKNTGDAILVNSSSHILINNNLIEDTQSTANYLDFALLQNYPFSIDVAYSRYVYIDNNILRNNWDGIWFWGSNYNSRAVNNTIYNHHFEGIGAGALTVNTTISGNSINGVRYGIWLVADLGPTYIENNSITNSVYGLNLQKTSNCIITNNTINSNSFYGVYISAKTTNCNITYNLVMNNDVGISISGSGHNIHFNDFYNNTNSAITDSNQSIDISYNFWSDLVKSDSNHDGIVDTYYKLQGSVDLFDKFPLINPVSPQLLQIVGTYINTPSSNKLGANIFNVYSLLMITSMFMFYKRKNPRF